MSGKAEASHWVGLILVLLTIASCNGAVQEYPADLSQETGSVATAAPQQVPEEVPTEWQWPDRAVSLPEALDDVVRYVPPVEGDPELYDMLAAELGRVLADLYGDDEAARHRRQVSYLPPTDWDRAWCFQCESLPTGVTTLHWRGRHLGDYNMDGMVTANDLTPLGYNYNVTVAYDADGLPVVNGENEWAAVVDGSADGLVGLNDITQIGQNYDSRLLGYRVYLGTTLDSATFTWETEYQANSDEPGADYTVGFKASRSAGGVQVYSWQFERPALADGEQLYARIVAWDGADEGTPTDIPVLAGPHAMFKCELCHRMPTMAFRGIEGPCWTCHAAPPESKSSSWADSPSLHNQCMICHSQHSFVIAPPQSVCARCHGAIVTQAAAAGMPECLGCHSAAHLPLDKPTATQCIGCHTEPPDKPGVSWDLAPGLHGDCNQCHNRHTFSIEPLEGVCVNCHSTLITGGHAGGSTDCLLCHNSPHLPEVSVSGMDCLLCHENPPEDLAAEWSEAPGNHAQCFMCHIGEEHGVKPEPPDSICGDCHEDVILGSHAPLSAECLSCHTYPHLPDFNISGADCVSCHPTPPEDPAAEWDQAPGQHAECAMCHLGDDHGVKPIPPETICGDCHGELVDDGHAGGVTDCLGCHTFPHLPEKPELHTVHLGEGMNCQECHGTHGHLIPGREKCMECHGDKVDHYPDDVCITCHTGR